MEFEPSHSDSSSLHEGRVGDVQVRALANRLLHAVGEIPESACHALAGDGEYGSETILADHDVNVFRLQSAEDSRFAAGRGAWIEMEEMLTTPLDHGERRPGLDLIRVKPAFQDETTGDVPMEPLDVLLALGWPIVADEVLQGVGLIDPLAHARSR